MFVRLERLNSTPPAAGRSPGQQSSSLIRTPYRAGSRPVATATIETFAEPALRLYEQDRKEPCGPSQLGMYVRWWSAWAKLVIIGLDRNHVSGRNVAAT